MKMGSQSGHDAIQPDWYPDPVGRHQYRYWDGQFWTDHVADDGEQGVDRLADAKSRLEAVRALDGVRGPQATEALIAALQDEDLEVQKCAARALGKRHSPAAVEPLFACLDSDSANLRIYVMESLIETEAAEAALVTALGEREYHPPDAKLDALAEAIRFGGLKGSPRCTRILRLAFRQSWASTKSLALLGLLIENGDPVGVGLSRAIDADDSAGVERILRSF